VTKNYKEQRREERVPTELPVELGGGNGIARDVSASGIFIETDASYGTGSPISFAVELETPGGRITLNCRGQIVRIEHRGGRLGIGVRIDESSLATPA
jgi:hypothetical protein